MAHFRLKISRRSFVILNITAFELQNVKEF